MLAVVEQGNKQYLVKRGQVIKVEKIVAELGQEIEMSSVKYVLDEKSKSIFGSGTVRAEVISMERDKKLVIFKKRRRKNSRRKNGHRQSVTVLRIKDIVI
ncbi:ribosomal protein L21 [Neorickettsia helminthoeca str. Oregon]|uniref:Large ribosomal subunit protein bL21 n=1 Tax=Neorickettsia helminthoeca str. Oregon TaxID=1286528 RepID=X5H4Z9_9RICK|nr:50S ribosomal protein L21 [Neorickettsia helminthoeca]AHX11773.1 ribosomal protein L21 [Neorickettsia helminthoeca str. Oregon]